jgi:hypothetical protein
LAVIAPGRSDAQTLKLRSLKIYPSDVVGPWVSYKVRTQSGRHAVREFTQRVAIVGRENTEDGTAYWVELKTSDPTRGVRIERGLFAEDQRLGSDSGELDPGPADSTAMPGETRPLRLIRYQMLTSDKKLYEYPVQSATAPRAAGEVSSFELFEFDPSLKPVRRFDGPDTLRIGRRVVPAVVERIFRGGSDDWASEADAGSVSRLVLSQTYWRNAAVPITGFARSLFRVTTVRVPIPPDSTGRPVIVSPPDSAALSTAASAADAGQAPVLSMTELLLQDLGADAVAEVTQKPEAAPASEMEGEGVEMSH